MYIIGSHIITPLGEGIEANFNAITAGQSGIRQYNDETLLPTPFYASRFPKKRTNSTYNSFEQLCIDCAGPAIRQADINAADPTTIFIISTTKGNIEALSQTNDIETISPAESAKRIARYFENQNTPIVVSNACTSGVCAQITALRLINAGLYNNAVVIGVDILSEFIITGFNCLKALSDQPCKPYDANRNGLNLGEAAACMIISNKYRPDSIQLINGSICNDANHISGPSRTAEGSMRVLQQIVSETDNLALINAHGTSTLYNDEMESIAVERAGLIDIPVNSLKSIFGHTMGAAGILETLITIQALRNNIILPTRNFQQLGVSRNIKVSNQQTKTDKKQFIKLMSGFGGCNAAMLCSLTPQQPLKYNAPYLTDIANVKLTSATDDINEIYKQQIEHYPKYLKMDMMCRLGFIATELIAKQQTLNADCAVIIFSRSGSLLNDINYQHTISDFPSPALFVYTLPNIVTGEIAIRHHLLTETSCYLLPYDDWDMIHKIVETTAAATNCSQVLYGWLEATPDNFCADMRLAQRNN